MWGKGDATPIFLASTLKSKKEGDISGVVCNFCYGDFPWSFLFYF